MLMTTSCVRNENLDVRVGGWYIRRCRGGDTNLPTECGKRGGNSSCPEKLPAVRHGANCIGMLGRVAPLLGPAPTPFRFEHAMRTSATFQRAVRVTTGRACHRRLCTL